MLMKMKCVNQNSFIWIFFIVFCVWSSSFETCNGRHSRPFGRKLKAASDNSATFNVLHYGAKGDGKTDDTKAFEDTWAEACKVEASTFEVPSGSVFLVGPITFEGRDCETNNVLQLDGQIKAPTSSSAWGSGTLQWLEFKDLKKFTFTGKGVIDGQGSAWWSGDSGLASTRPTALRFYGSDGVTVTGITIQNSQKVHLKFDSCTNVEVSAISVSSPGDSPNTDGIHLQNSQNVVIYSSTLACGDDCVSIQTGCSNIYIHDVDCGPGHGFSVGSLGEENNKACVSNVTVRDVTLKNTLTGVRIKTRQGGSGSAQGIMFSNIQVSDVETPIMIDQYYCEQSKCQNESSAVAVSGVRYVNIKGTYTKEPVRLACSDSTPCTDLTFNTIQLQPSSVSNGPFCWEAYGELKTETTPPIHCLQSGNPSSSAIHSTQDSC